MRVLFGVNTLATVWLAVLLSAGDTFGQTAAGLCEDYCWTVLTCELGGCRVDAETGSVTDCYYDCGYPRGNCSLDSNGNNWSCTY